MVIDFSASCSYHSVAKPEEDACGATYYEDHVSFGATHEENDTTA
jgi:hypothetical protein